TDFKYVRTFWDGAQAPAPFTPDVFMDVKHPFGISPAGISAPIQNPFNPFTVADYTSPGGTDPKVPGSHISAVPPGTQLTTGVRYAALEAGLRTDKITTHNYEFTGGLKGNLGEFGDYFRTWNWQAGFRYSEDSRIERFAGNVDSNALRAALLDTDPATAFNPFGINHNSPAVINRIFATTHRLGTASLMLEDLKLYGELWNLPAGPIAFAIGGEHWTEHEAYHAPALAELYTSQGQILVLVDDPAGLTPPNTVIKETVGGNPNLNAEVAYEWTYGVVWTPAKLIKGLTLSADFYHIDLRNVI